MSTSKPSTAVLLEQANESVKTDPRKAESLYKQVLQAPKGVSITAVPRDTS